jgi:anaerobic selenocysteine-containing dehydrogenase
MTTSDRTCGSRTVAEADDEGSVTVARTCPLCEARCGLAVTVRHGVVRHIRGDMLDVFSHGHLCPKRSTLEQLHDDPDRLRQPLVRRGDRSEPVGSSGSSLNANVLADTELFDAVSGTAVLDGIPVDVSRAR